MAVRVPFLYKLELGLPINIDNLSAKSYFDCKLRKLFVILNAQTQKLNSTNGEASSKIEIVDTKKLENDLLFDVI